MSDGPERGLVLEIARPQHVRRRRCPRSDRRRQCRWLPARCARQGAVGISGDDLHRLLELAAEPGRQLRVLGGRTVCTASPSRCASSGPLQRDIQLHRVHVAGALCGVRVEEQSLLQRGQRQDVGDTVVPAAARRSRPGSTRRGRYPMESIRRRRFAHARRCRPGPRTTTGSIG